MARRISRHLRNDNRAISPAISTTILTAAIVVMLLVVISFVNSYLDGQIAQNDFNSMKQFMQTIAQQADDVAWIPGRTQTLAFASKYGQVTFQSPALTYSFYFDGSLVASFPVGAILFSIPVGEYSVANNYFEEIFPSSQDLLQNGTSAPVCRTFVTEKLPMQDGNYIRIVVVPIVRQLNATINAVSYARFYLPIFFRGSSPELSQSVTLTGLNVFHGIFSNDSNSTNTVTISMDFPDAGNGLTADFFNFNSANQTVVLGSNSVVEIYGGNVTVSLGISA